MAFFTDSIFWVETEKVVPNPFQPRREFDEAKLKELSESIRMYGILQPLTVTRREVTRDDGAFYTEYELIAGERRLRASRLAGLEQVPVIIRDGEQSEQEKLELAIIENLQREDLNAVDRALAFKQLADAFKLSHAKIAKKVGRSREYITNSMRLLMLPEHILDSIRRGELTEGHARTMLMLADRPEELETLYRETLLKKFSVREVERIARTIANDKVRNPKYKIVNPVLMELEKQFTDTLGTRVQIQKTDFGGRLTIDYFSEDELEKILTLVRQEGSAPAAVPPHGEANDALAALAEHTALQVAEVPPQEQESAPEQTAEEAVENVFAQAVEPESVPVQEVEPEAEMPEVERAAMESPDGRAPEPEEDDSDLYSIRSFNI